MRVRIDQDTCVGSGQCAFAVPKVFDQRESDGVSYVRQEPGPDDEEDVRQAVLICPAQAIEITESDGSR